MYSEEPVQFVISNDIRRGPFDAIRRKWRLRIGEWLSYFLEPVLRLREINKLHTVQNARAADGGARLSRAQFLELQDYQETALDLEIRKRDFRNSDHRTTFHGIAPPYVETVLKQDPSIRSVLDIGCNYAYMDHVMAKRFPKVHFYGIDVPRELVEINADLALPNLTIHSGYALELLENGVVRPDLCYFSSTCAPIRNLELKSYFRQLAKTTKWLVLSEPVYPSPGRLNEEGYYDDPDAIDADGSRATYLQIHFYSQKRGYLNYLHNYRAITEACGWEVLHYRVFQPHFTSMHWVTLVARNADRSLWESGAPAA